MKKLLLILACIFALCACAHAEEHFDGTVYDAYRPVYDEAFLSGWEIISYIEPSGLLLSATAGSAEISVTVQETSAAPAAFLTSHVAGVTRYGKDIQGGNVVSVVLGGYEQAARVSYSYRSLRDSGEGDIYNVEMVAAKLRTGFVLTLSYTYWGMEANPVDFLGGFVSGFSLESVRISTTYYALLTHCEGTSDGVYLTLDYCDVEFEPALGIAYAINNDDSAYTYRLDDRAQIWLPETGGALYSLKHVGADDTEISIAIETYYNLHEVHAIYQVLFDESGDIIRLQHYNAL